MSQWTGDVRIVGQKRSDFLFAENKTRTTHIADCFLCHNGQEMLGKCDKNDHVYNELREKEVIMEKGETTEGEQ